MSFPYSKRFAGGFADLPAQTTDIDSAFLNAVEAALLALCHSAPSTNQVPIYDGTNFTPGQIADAQVAAAAAIAVSKVAGGLAGQVLQGTTPSYAYPPGFEIAYDQITSGVTVASTTEGSPTTIISGTSHTYENVPYLFHFFAPDWEDSSAAGGVVIALLIEDAASIGRIALLESITGSTQILSPAVGEYRFTPTAGAHTFGVAAFATSTTGTPVINAGTGGSGLSVPAFLRVTKC